MTLYFDTFATPLGNMTAVATDTGALCLLDFSDCSDRFERLLQRRFGSFVQAYRQNPQGIRERLADYFGTRNSHTAFNGLDLDIGGTAFQQNVWKVLKEIPYGETISYSELATRVCAPRAVRAVGSANGRNPVAIIIPCHRVIAKNGALAGYAGGVERKRQLLALESGIFKLREMT